MNDTHPAENTFEVVNPVVNGNLGWVVHPQVEPV